MITSFGVTPTGRLVTYGPDDDAPFILGGSLFLELGTEAVRLECGLVPPTGRYRVEDPFLLVTAFAEKLMRD